MLVLNIYATLYSLLIDAIRDIDLSFVEIRGLLQTRDSSHHCCARLHCFRSPTQWIRLLPSRGSTRPLTKGKSWLWPPSDQSEAQLSESPARSNSMSEPSRLMKRVPDLRYHGDGRAWWPGGSEQPCSQDLWSRGRCRPEDCHSHWQSWETPCWLFHLHPSTLTQQPPQASTSCSSQCSSLECLISTLTARTGQYSTVQYNTVLHRTMTYLKWNKVVVQL